MYTKKSKKTTHPFLKDMMLHVLPIELRDLVLIAAGRTGRIKLTCAELLGQPRGLRSTPPDIIWTVLCAALFTGLEDCCLALMLHLDAPLQSLCGARYVELVYALAIGTGKCAVSATTNEKIKIMFKKIKKKTIDR